MTSPIEQRGQRLKTLGWQLVSHNTVGFVATGIMQRLETELFWWLNHDFGKGQPHRSNGLDRDLSPVILSHTHHTKLSPITESSF